MENHAWAKYEPLFGAFCSRSRRHVPMTFAEIEKVLGFTLPASARRHRGLVEQQSGGNVMTNARHGVAGYRTEDVNFEDETVGFRRRIGEINRDQSSMTRQQEGGSREEAAHGIHLSDGLKGTITILSGVDLTEPR